MPFFDYNYLIKSQKLIYKKGNWTDYKINLFKSFIIYKISNIVNSIKKTEFGIFQLNKSKLITNKFDKLNINKIYF